VTEQKKKKPTLEALIMRMLHEADGRMINPMVVAKHFAEGRKGDDASAGTWAREVRNAAIGLARAGKIVIYRKGEPADPEDFRGVYRLGLPDAQPEAEDEGDE
jgi:hypothetical protein